MEGVGDGTAGHRGICGKIWVCGHGFRCGADGGGAIIWDRGIRDDEQGRRLMLVYARCRRLTVGIFWHLFI